MNIIISVGVSDLAFSVRSGNDGFSLHYILVSHTSSKRNTLSHTQFTTHDSPYPFFLLLNCSHSGWDGFRSVNEKTCMVLEELNRGLGNREKLGRKRFSHCSQLAPRHVSESYESVLPMGEYTHALSYKQAEIERRRERSRWREYPLKAARSAASSAK